MPSPFISGVCFPTNALFVVFSSNQSPGKLLTAPTYLKPGHYVDGGIIGQAHRKRVQRPVIYYHLGKQVWTGTRHYGTNCEIAPGRPGP